MATAAGTSGGARTAHALELPPLIVPPGDRMPKYVRLKELLLGVISELPLGSPLPTERHLCDAYEVSRTTVRQALQELFVEGYLDRQQGRGTFVARPKVDQRLALTSYTDDMRARGLRPASRLLDLERVEADAELEEALAVPAGRTVLRVRRLRLADDEPMAIETLFVPAERFGDLERRLTETTSFYGLLADVYGVELGEAEETIEATVAAPADARALGTETGAPLLLLSRRTSDVAGRPVEFVRSLYRGDRYRFVTRMAGPPGAR